MGNSSPVASICGEIDSGAEFYDYEAKYVTDTSRAYIPARIADDVEEAVRDAAVKVYSAIGCQGLSRVDFFVTDKEQKVVFNEINTIPGFTSISMYPKLFAASGIPYSQLIDELLRLAVEAFKVLFCPFRDGRATGARSRIPLSWFPRVSFPTGTAAGMCAIRKVSSRALPA